MTSPLQAVIGWVSFAVVRALAATYRFRTAGPAPGAGAHYILAIWHQNLFAGILAQTGRCHIVMISRSRDGAAVANMCARLGHRVARGSSKKRNVDKGGQEAKDEMIELLRSGLSGALTVDGPRGPAHVVKPGIIEMARATGIPIVPYVPLPARYWKFRSWDAFRLPKPFTRIDVCYGAPLHIPANTAFEGFVAFQDQIAQSLNDIEAAHLARDLAVSARVSA